MGEPLLNWDAVDATLTILNQPAGSASCSTHHRIDRGILPSLAKFAQRAEQFRWQSPCMRPQRRCAKS